MRWMILLSAAACTQTDADPVDTGTTADEVVGYGELEPRPQFEDLEALEVHQDGIFAIYWYPQFDHADDAMVLGERLNAVRDRCLGELGMADPPNPAAGTTFNVYIHHGEDDPFPTWWANGVGTNDLGLPYMTLPNGAHADLGNVLHEGFHVFQYEATSPGFGYAGDSQWYVESSAQWFMADELGQDDGAFIESYTLTRNPHLTLWHSFDNEAPGDPVDWNYQVRQYGMHAYLYYLTSQAGVDPAVVTDGFYAGTSLSPQAYHAEQVGLAELRGHFADWAARNTTGMDYLTPGQVARSIEEFDWVGDPDNVAPVVLTVDGDVDGWRPEPALTPRGWSYNVVDLLGAESATVRFTADAAGSDGGASHFALRWVDDLGGVTPIEVVEGVADATWERPASAAQGWLVVASVPEVWVGNQTYGYALTIDVPPAAGP
jgi:hypothetical protein